MVGYTVTVSAAPAGWFYRLVAELAFVGFWVGQAAVGSMGCGGPAVCVGSGGGGSAHVEEGMGTVLHVWGLRVVAAGHGDGKLGDVLDFYLLDVGGGLGGLGYPMVRMVVDVAFLNVLCGVDRLPTSTTAVGGVCPAVVVDWEEGGVLPPFAVEEVVVGFTGSAVSDAAASLLLVLLGVSCLAQGTG